MLELVKEELRIMHNRLDATITRHIEAAKAEMELKGIKPENIDDSDPLIINCIVSYVQMRFTDDTKEQEMYYKGFETQLDGLRKSIRYGGEVE